MGYDGLQSLLTGQDSSEGVGVGLQSGAVVRSAHLLQPDGPDHQSQTSPHPTQQSAAQTAGQRTATIASTCRSQPATG